MSERAPIFAVVGKVNKGKSSILATLSENSSVETSPLPRTTRTCQSFPVSVDGRLLFTLIDTPGFQQSRKVLKWLRDHKKDAPSPPDVVRLFLEEFEESDKFKDEWELLDAIMRGAGILYVVDGSRPFRSPYQAEMECLRWTGQPRMALINAIGEQDHRERWRIELDQYFSIVRDFDAHQVSFIERVRLLRGMRELREEWRPPLDEAIVHLVEEWRRRRRATARGLAAMIIEALTLTIEESVPEEGGASAVGDRLSGRFHARLRDRERGARDEIEALYAHGDLTRQEDELAPPVWDQDLFAESSWAMLGLNTKQLIIAGAAAGAVTGGTIDAFVGGASFMTGALIGTVGGALGSVRYASRRLASPERVWRSLRGERLMRIGPHKNPNFPWVLLDRAILHWLAVRDWAHARQGALEIATIEESPSVVARLVEDEHKRLAKLFRQMSKRPEKVTEKQRAALEGLLVELLERFSEEEEQALCAG